MAGKQYVVVAGFHQVVDKHGNEKRYEPGDTHPGLDAANLLKKQLIAEKPSASSDSSNKES